MWQLRMFLAGLFLILAMCSVQAASAPQDADMLFLITVKDKHGFIDRSGKVVIPPRFEEAEEFSEGLAVVKVNGLYGYIDATGQFAIKPKFYKADSFSSGLAGVFSPDGGRYGSMGYIDRTGSMVITLPSEHREFPSPFSEGLVPIAGEGKAGYMDATGKVVIPAQFDAAFPFSEGLAQVLIGKRYGYIDKAGRVRIEPQFFMGSIVDHLGRPHPSVPSSPFREGLAGVKLDDKDAWGYIDQTGKLIFKTGTRSDRAYVFSDGLAIVVNDYDFGFMDRTGKVVIETRFNYAEDFSEGLAPVRVRVNNKWDYDDLWGYIDKSGEMLIPPRFTGADRFEGGLAKVQIRTKKRMEGSDLYSLGYIDRTGKVVWSTVVE